MSRKKRTVFPENVDSCAVGVRVERRSGKYRKETPFNVRFVVDRAAVQSQVGASE